MSTENNQMEMEEGSEKKVNTYFDMAMDKVDQGLRGYNSGIELPPQLKRLNEELCGIQKATYYLIGARLKVGKTSFADNIFLYHAYDYYKSVKGTESEIGLDIDYYSFEIDTASKILKGISRKIAIDHKLYLPVKYIINKGKYWVSQEHYDLVKSYRKYFEELEDVLQIFDKGLHPTGIAAYLEKKARARGTIEYKHVRADASDVDSFTYKTFKGYTPKNPNLYHLAIVDHVALTHTEKGMTSTKEAIDKLSGFFVNLRNKYGLTPVVIQQFKSWSDESESKMRRGSPVPTLDSFSDSRYTPRDANVIMALHDPYNYMRITNEESYRGYPIGFFRDNFRGLEILRNRDGAPNQNLGLLFFGGIGQYYELPSRKYFESDDPEHLKIANSFKESSIAINKHYENSKALPKRLDK